MGAFEGDLFVFVPQGILLCVGVVLECFAGPAILEATGDSFRATEIENSGRRLKKSSILEHLGICSAHEKRWGVIDGMLCG